MERTFLRRTFTLKNGLRLITGLVLVAAGLTAAKAWWDSRVFAGYDAALPLDPQLRSESRLQGFPVSDVEITGLPGERLPIRFINPAAGTGKKIPAVIFLYGIGQNARFFDKVAPVFAEAGFAMAMPEQFNCGTRRQAKRNPVREILSLRERSSRIVPETRRVVDFLEQVPEVDPERIYVIGASYGGITASSVLAHEPRIRKAALVMAGGNLPRLLESLMYTHAPRFRLIVPVAAPLMACLMSPFEPLNFIGEISPRELLFLDVTNDEMIDPACGAVLYEKAKGPKSRRVYEDAHNTISENTVRQMLQDALQWFEE